MVESRTAFRTGGVALPGTWPDRTHCFGWFCATPEESIPTTSLATPQIAACLAEHRGLRSGFPASEGESGAVEDTCELGW